MGWQSRSAGGGVMALTLITGPTHEPLSLGETKDHLRVDGTDDDALIEALIIAARRHAEGFTWRVFISQVWDLHLDAFPTGTLLLPTPPLISVASVKYYDAADVQQTLAASTYQVDAASEPGRLALADGQSWPTPDVRLNAVTIRFTAGWADRSQVPADIKSALLLLIGHWFAHRETVIVGQTPAELPMATTALLWYWRTWMP